MQSYLNLAGAKGQGEILRCGVRGIKGHLSLLIGVTQRKSKLFHIFMIGGCKVVRLQLYHRTWEIRDRGAISFEDFFFFF